MKNKIVTVFGGSGFLGKNIVQELVKQGYLVRVASRNPERNIEVKTGAMVGQVTLEHCNIRDEKSIANCLRDSWAVVNLVGVLYEKGRQSFQAVHAQGAEKIAKAAKNAGVKRLIHISALGVDKAVKSKYARTKITGEKAVVSAFPSATILRPSVVFGAEDNFFNMFAKIASCSPILPLIGGGKTIFQPVYVVDVAKAVVWSLENDESSAKVFELGGPKKYSFKDLMAYLLVQINKPKKLLIDVPYGIANLIGAFSEFAPKPLLTRDQVALLKYDNVVSETARGFKEMGIAPTPLESIVPLYMERFKG